MRHRRGAEAAARMLAACIREGRAIVLGMSSLGRDAMEITEHGLIGCGDVPLVEGDVLGASSELGLEEGVRGGDVWASGM